MKNPVEISLRDFLCSRSIKMKVALATSTAFAAMGRA